MDNNEVYWFFGVLFVIILKTEATTHWMVTESGLIEPKHDSPFNMNQPHDLLALMDQEERWIKVFDIYQDLIKKQEQVNKIWADLERESDLEPHLSENQYCVKAGNLNLFNWYISFLDGSSSKYIPEPKHLISKPNPGHTYDVPDCKKISSLIFSMFAFEHLESLRERSNLTVHPDHNLFESQQTVDLFGHWLYDLLKQNTSSWLHYDMAAIYWRIKGNAPKAIECSRRAVHYVPREHKDLVLLNMGTILHHSKNTEDALVVLNAAVDHNSQSYMGHFALANGYAVTGEYNLSLYHFNLSLKINPQDETKFTYVPCILCHESLTPKVIAIKKTLELLRKELNEYQQKEKVWPNIQYDFLKTLKSAEEFDEDNVDKNCARMSEVMNTDVKELKRHSDRYYLMRYFLDDPVYSGKWERAKGVLAIEAVYSLQRLIKHIENNVHLPPEKIIKLDRVQIHIHVADESKQCNDKYNKDKKLSAACKQAGISKPQNEVEKEMSEYEVGVFMYPSTMKVNRNKEDFDIENEWPSDEFCQDAAANFPDDLEAIYPVFLPFENKGIRIGTLLTEKIGVPLWEEHELPWHPPTCPHDRDAAAYTQKKFAKTPFLAEVIDNGYLRKKLLEYLSNDNLALVKNMQDAEIGQRIYAATNKKVAPQWMVLVLSSLYWRVRGNNANALHCLLAASRVVQPRYKDIVMTSLASVHLEMGHLDEGILAIEESFKLGVYDPATNFVLAEISMLKKHRNTQLFHLKQVLRVEHTFMGGLARNLLNGWACVIKQVNSLHEINFVDTNICTQVEPGVTVVCKKDGGSCYFTNFKCRESNSDVSSLLRLLDHSNDLREPGFINERFFDWVLEEAPADRTDKVAHRDHFEDMMRVISKLKGCGPKGCKSIKPADLSLQEEDCKFFRVQFGYWVQNIKDMIAEADLGVISEISAIPVTGRKTPECRIILDPQDDFFLDRIRVLDIDGWAPLMNIAHQLAELFSVYDYVSLGSKIARYVETRNNCWTGALFASWWCGVVGHGACALRCLSAAHALAPPSRAHLALRVLVVLLLFQSKLEDAKEMAYLSFYTSPKSKTEAYLAAIAHSNLEEYEQAIWMYRYALKLDGEYLAAKACLHGNMCLMLFGNNEEKA